MAKSVTYLVLSAAVFLELILPSLGSPVLSGETSLKSQPEDSSVLGNISPEFKEFVKKLETLFNLLESLALEVGIEIGVGSQNKVIERRQALWSGLSQTTRDILQKFLHLQLEEPDKPEESESPEGSGSPELPGDCEEYEYTEDVEMIEEPESSEKSENAENVKSAHASARAEKLENAHATDIAEESEFPEKKENPN